MKMKELILLDDFSDIRLALIVVEKAVEIGPFFNLSSPLLKGSEGSQNQEGPYDSFISVEMIEEGDSLNSFAKPHFVSQYSVPILVPALDKPVQTLQLKFLEFSIVFKDWNILIAVLSRFSFLTCIQPIHLRFHLGNIGIVIVVLLITDVLIVLKQKFMYFIMNFKLFPDIFDGYFIVCLKLFYFLRTSKDLLGLPCSIVIAHISPFDIVQFICFCI